MGRLSLRGVFLALVVSLVGFHLVSVTAAALPPNRYSEVVEPANGYLRPYFTQNWRLFAPNPVAEDRDLLVQAAYRDADGKIQVTEWIDWTEVELDLVHHKVVGRRGGYVTSKLIGSLSASRARLTTVQRDTLVDPSQDAPWTWATLEARLNAGGLLPAVVAKYLRYDVATIRLATDILVVRYPNLDIVGVQYAIRRTPVVGYLNRHVSAERKDDMRIGVNTASGWRRPVNGTEAERKVIAEFDRRHR